MKLLSLAGLAVLVTSAVPAFAEAPYPYLGSWGGGPASCADPFRFGVTTYRSPGGAVMRVRKVGRSRGAYVLGFADGYRVTLSRVTPTSLNWASAASGDGFTLTRCP